MINSIQSEQLQKIVAESQSALVLLPPTPEEDWVYGALALGNALESLGKKVTIGCSSDVDLVVTGVEAIKRTVGGRNLIVSFPYKESMVEKVSYDIDETGERFNLIIKPKENSEPLDPKSVEFTYTGATADVVFTFGLTALEELGKIYSDEKTFLDTAKVVNLRRSGNPVDFTDMDIQNPKLSSVSELVAHISRLIDAKLAPEQASALYKQLTQKTQNFSSFNVTADTFDVAAYLMRQGATRAPAFTPPFQKPAFQPPVQAQNQPNQPKFNNQKPGVPSDWQGPKIFRAGDNKPDLLK
jgi:hypothetical protein